MILHCKMLEILIARALNVFKPISMLLTNSNNFKSYKTSLKLDLSGKKQQESRKNLKMKNTEKKPLMDLTETIQVLINYQKMDFKVKIKSKSREPINSQDKILTIIL